MYVGNISTDFAVKDSSNSLAAQIRKTGIYLNEDGTPGTIQHVDMVI